MFAYCRNNPVSRKDAFGSTDQDIMDDDSNLLDDDKVHAGGKLGNGGRSGSGAGRGGGGSGAGRGGSGGGSGGSTSSGAGNGAPNLGNKLKYIFGKATGSTENIKRSTSMNTQLNKVGIWDNSAGNSYLRERITYSYYNSEPYASGRYVARDIMLYGCGGGVMLKTIWNGPNLITCYVLK